jgi:hypothetical protein
MTQNLESISRSTHDVHRHFEAKTTHIERRKGEIHCLEPLLGQGQTFNTGQKSIADRCSGIDLVDLSQNFRDAIKVARSLRMRNIWVDFLGYHTR